MNRRGFLSSILIAGAAPAIVRVDALMRVRQRDETVLTLDTVMESRKSVRLQAFHDLAEWNAGVVSSVIFEALYLTEP